MILWSISEHFMETDDMHSKERERERIINNIIVLYRFARSLLQFQQNLIYDSQIDTLRWFSLKVYRQTDKQTNKNNK